MSPYHVQAYPCLGRHYAQALRLIIAFFLNIVLILFPIVLDRYLLVGEAGTVLTRGRDKPLWSRGRAGISPPDALS